MNGPLLLYTAMMRSHFHVLLLIFLVKAGTCAFTFPLTGTEVVAEGSTFYKTVIKTSQLKKDDQVFVRCYRSFSEPKLCAQYFCDNGKCDNDPTTVGHFRVELDSLVLVIPKVNITNSGLYSVILNGYRTLLNFTLSVEGQTSAMPDSTNAAQEMPNKSTRGRFFVYIAVAVIFVVVLIGLICWKRSKCLEDSDPKQNGLLDRCTSPDQHMSQKCHTSTTI
ncbi:uncharacterized protein LOC127418831 [Myxocyprinus asiaticus]|uniref:uncharacterized protein LOC127418831 n=1 Tax=Myxocyprinus asiaticus TaxID=70543 RepID=UPI002222B546|nr:uncharacterized protein LOC127418831 [Myxocyprinus asiaticus]